MNPELMDDPALDADAHRLALRGLARINRWSGAARALWRPIESLARQGSHPIRILDVACGGGDALVALHRRARNHRNDIRMAGCDISSTALTVAQQSAANSHCEIDFFQHDVLSDTIEGGYDCIMCSLFLHHLDDGQAKMLLDRMIEAANRLVIVNDLRRCPAGYCVAWLGTRMLSRSPIVQHDGPQSVRAAFAIDELKNMADASGMTRAIIRRVWPFRMQLEWMRD